MQKQALTRDDLDKWINELHGVAMRHLAVGELIEATAVCIDELSVLEKAVDPEDRRYLDGIAKVLLIQLRVAFPAKDLSMPNGPISSLTILHHEHGGAAVLAVHGGSS
ncbi:MAG: hypothetical protein ACN6RK_05085 [Stenotrophomonas sp.]